LEASLSNRTAPPPDVTRACREPASAAVSDEPAVWLTRVTAPVTRSWRNTSEALLPSVTPGTTLGASLVKAA
jgi:hypothetical protein